MKFYPLDWIADTQILDMRSRGVWITVLCQLWLSDTPGERTWNRSSFEVLLADVRYDEEVAAVVVDLDRVGEVSYLDELGGEVETYADAVFIRIKSRRMVRDWAQLNGVKEKHKRYNAKRTTKQRPDNDQETTGRSQKSEAKKKSDADAAFEDEGILTALNPIYQVDPKKFARLGSWVRAAAKHHRPAVIVLALNRFRPYSQTVSGHWWPYLEKLLDKAEKDTNFAEHEKNHEQMKAEWKETLGGLIKKGE
jgi:hypothetical protein